MSHLMSQMIWAFHEKFKFNSKWVVQKDLTLKIAYFQLYAHLHPTDTVKWSDADTSSMSSALLKYCCALEWGQCYLANEET